MGLPNPSRETKFSGANGDKEYFIFPVQLADREQDWQPCKFVLSRVLLMAYSSILLEYVLDSTYS